MAPPHLPAPDDFLWTLASSPQLFLLSRSPCSQATVATPEAAAQQEGGMAIQYTGGTDGGFGGGDVTPAAQGLGGFDADAMDVA